MFQIVRYGTDPGRSGVKSSHREAARTGAERRMNRTRRPAFPLVISGPSGAGKTSVVEWLLREDEDLVLSVSCTTRACRGEEVEGIDYFYVDESEFLARRDRSEFCEWALVHGNLYGTPESFLDRRIADGKTVLLDIDVQGAMQIREAREGRNPKTGEPARIDPRKVLVFRASHVLKDRMNGVEPSDDS